MVADTREVIERLLEEHDMCGVYDCEQMPGCPPHCQTHRCNEPWPCAYVRAAAALQAGQELADVMVECKRVAMNSSLPFSDDVWLPLSRRLDDAKAALVAAYRKE